MTAGWHGPTTIKDAGIVVSIYFISGIVFIQFSSNLEIYFIEIAPKLTALLFTI